MTVTEAISMDLSTNDRVAIQINFLRNEDRWSHRWFSDRNQPVTWLQSIEGTADQNWPPSPPLQELNQLELEQGDSVLGVGMAGRSHWSASYSVEKMADGSCIKADLACLQKGIEAPTLTNPDDPNLDTQLGSAYELGPDCEIDVAQENRVEIVTPTKQRVVLMTVGEGDCATILRVDQRILSMVPAQVSKSPVHSTRWAFRVFVAG